MDCYLTSKLILFTPIKDVGKIYINKKYIEAYKKKPVETPFSSPKKKFQSSIDSSNFGWEKNCFLCGHETDKEKEAKLNKNRRIQVSYINTSTLNDSVMNFIAVQKNDCYREIHKTISGITNLHALQAKYHADHYNLIKNSIHLSNVYKKFAPRSLMIDGANIHVHRGK
ncbi:hypothetical protein TNCV_2236761 [Trichonephila clavipes]|nr:hypothetical protein TNCV_2236761 [Trichonephila clavipes]